MYMILHNSGGTGNCLTQVLRANTYLYDIYTRTYVYLHALEPPPPRPTRPVCMYFSNMFADLKPARGRWKKTRRRAIHLPLRTALYYYALWWWGENKIRDRFTNVALNIMSANPSVVFFYRSVWQTFRTLSNVQEPVIVLYNMYLYMYGGEKKWKTTHGGP